MAALIDSDVFAGASQHAMREHLTSPFRAGALELPVAIDGNGAAKVDVTTREPLLLAWPLAGLEEEGLRLEAIVSPDGGADVGVVLEFAPYTEEGAALPLYRPPTDPSSHLAGKFSLKLTLSQRGMDGSLTPVGQAGIASLVALEIVEGVTGRVLYILGAEKSRMRRAGRELAAQLRLARARDNALDRHGADLGVARFTDTLSVRNGEIVTNPEREADASFRRRLRLYRPFLMPTRKNVLELLNGPGETTDPNAGALAGLGVRDRFDLTERPNPISVAVHLVAVGGNDATDRRHKLQQAIREIHLLWPLATPRSNQVHAARFLADPIRDQQQQLRKLARTACSFERDAEKNPALAPMLATALARAGAARKELGVDTPLTVTRVQDNDSGSRYELGLGADLVALDGAELDKLVEGAKAIDLEKVDDPELRALISGLDPKSAADDPDGAWLLEPCGLRTVFRVTKDQLYVSHLPTLGLRIDAADTVAEGGTLQLEAHDEAPGDAASNAALSTAVSAALNAWPPPAPAQLTPADAQTAWNAAAPRAAGDQALQVFAAAGLAGAQDPRPLAQRLGRLPVELVRTLKLAAAQSARIVSGPDPAAAATELSAQVQVLRDNGIASVLPIVSGTDVLLVLSVIGLPGAGVNLAGRTAVTFRWYQVPVIGDEGVLGPRGARTTFRPSGSGIVALVCVGYTRRGLVDPLEYRVELPPTAVIGLSAYEFVMNLLDRAHPMGVQINTYGLRHDHVDLAGQGDPTPLTPHVSRTYRRFQRRRSRGQEGVPLDG